MEIGENAFAKCSELKEIKLNSGLEKIGKSAFEYAPLESVELPETLTEICDNAFYGCETLAAMNCDFLEIIMNIPRSERKKESLVE